MVSLRHLTLFVGIALAAPVIDTRAAQVLPGKYIVTLKPGVSVLDINSGSHMNWVRAVHARSLSRRDTGGVEKVFNLDDFNAYAGTFDATTIAAIRNSEDVAAVEPDMVWKLDRDALVSQTSSTWGLGSISHRTPNHTNYIFNPNGGQGTFAYVVDSGIRTTHTEFEGRAFLGYNAFPDTEFVDRLGHGTHVSATIAGKTYGVAKKATLIAVRVFDTGETATSTVMTGYVWAANNITATNRTATSVINMSLGGPFSSTFNALVKTAATAGILTVVSAGNSGVDASLQSPSSAPEALTVGAVDVYNAKPAWSNWGEAVDVFAPGVDVLSAYSSGDTATARANGTSMAAPHVAGLVLYFKSLEGGKRAVAGVEGVVGRIKGEATAGVLSGVGEGSPNLLAYNGNGA